MPPRKHDIRDDDWRRVDIRTLTIGTRLEKKNGKQGQEAQRFQSDEIQQTPGELKEKIIPGDLEYSDDAKLLIEKTHMSNYVNEWETTT